MSEADRLERDLEQDREHLRATLGAIEDKMSPGRLLDEAMAYFNTGPKAFASDLTTQIRDNPMPALLTGVGIAWLMMSDRRAQTAPAAGGVETATSVDGFGFSVDPADYDAWHEHDRLQQAEWSCIRMDDETPEAHALRLDQARAAALGIAYDPQEDQARFSSRVRGAADTVKQKGASARDKLGQAAAATRHKAASGVHGMKSGASSAASGAKAAVASSARFHEANPVATGAIGVALGALLGAALPLSRKEEAALAGVADKGLAVGAELTQKGSDALADRIKPTGGDGQQPSGSPEAARF